MKKILLFIVLQMYCLGNAQTGCENFKTGSFRYTDPKFSNTIITRTDTTQTEIDNDNGFKISGTIEWTSDCSYVLTCTYINTIDQSMVGKKIYVEISTVTAEKCMCDSSFEDKKMKLELIKIYSQ